MGHVPEVLFQSTTCHRTRQALELSAATECYIVLWPGAVVLPKAGLPQQKEFLPKRVNAAVFDTARGYLRENYPPYDTSSFSP